MAWPKDKRELIEFLEDGIFRVTYVMGYLGSLEDPQAVKCEEKLRALWDEWRRIRMSQYRQMGFWDETETDD